MTRTTGRTAMMTLGLALLAGAGAWAGATPAQKCQDGKNKEAGKYAYCRQKAEGKLASTGDTAKYTATLATCVTKYATKWAAVETKAAGACPTTGDQTAIQGAVDTHTTNIATALGGGGLDDCPGDLATCGTDLATCAADLAACEASSAGGAFPATGQTTCWNSAGTVIACAGTGHDGDVQAGATLAYTDNGDGTITDNNTGLMWEKLSDDGSIHDKDNSYTWDNAFAVKVASLNSGGGFAGHTDWRVPNVKELQSIVNYEIPYPGPSVSAAFNTGCAPSCTVTTCSCTQSDYYWSSSTYAGYPTLAWFVYFSSGNVHAYGKTNDTYVRAVRGGS